MIALKGSYKHQDEKRTLEKKPNVGQLHAEIADQSSHKGLGLIRGVDFAEIGLRSAFLYVSQLNLLFCMIKVEISHLYSLSRESRNGLFEHAVNRFQKRRYNALNSDQDTDKLVLFL